MAEPTVNIVRRLLRASEDAKVAVRARIIPVQEPPQDPFAPDDESVHHHQAHDSDKNRIVAIITHVDSSTGDEQGCTFILQPKRRRGPSTQPVFAVEHVFPILESFTINMAQSRRNIMNLTSSAPLDQPRADFTLTIHPGHDPLMQPVNLSVTDTHGLRTLLAECKRLKDTAVANNEPGTITPFPWILPYVVKDQPTVLSPAPRDLRHFRRPFDGLLSEAYAGSPGDDVFDISLIREEWMRSKVNEVYDAIKEVAHLTIRIGTFNVNGKLPSQDLSVWVRDFLDRTTPKLPAAESPPQSTEEMSQSVSHTADNPISTVGSPELRGPGSVTPGSLSRTSSTTLISRDQGAGDDIDPDLIILGFQELDLSASALLYSTDLTREDAWFTAAMAGLGEKAELYTKLASKQLVGMLLIAIVKRSVKDRFTQVQTASVGAGIMGLMGNKGATALRLTYTPAPTADTVTPRPAVLTFVNAHLAAFDEMFEKRNQDFHDISKRLVFDSGIPAHDLNNPDEDFTSPTVPLNVYQSDSLFWIGDLNYRLNLADDDVRTLLSENNEDSLSVLLNYDQLNQAARTQQAFVHFSESPITHLPSYRFNSAVQTDALGYDSKRKPAWTDRILHMSSPVANVRQLSYAMHPEITMSDHRPVSAVFKVDIPLVDTDELEGYVHGLWQDVTNFEDSEEVPRLKVDTPVVDFGSIRYKQRQSRTLRVGNAGQVPSVFRFVPVAAGEDLHPDWLRIEPKAGLLLPGEHMEIVFIAEVGDIAAKQLNLSDGRLEETLILHTALGKDHFLTVAGQYERTCFATSLARLVRMPGPVRSPASQQLLPEDDASNAPREIMRLVNWLMAEASDVDTLFLEPGEEEWIHHIRESLDSGADFPARPEDQKAAFSLSVAQCLLQLLDSLPEPIVPFSAQPGCVQAASRDEAFETLNQFPGPSVNVWICVTSFLHFISQQASSERKAERLAAVFAPIFFGESAASQVVSPVGKRNFVLHFIR